MVASSKAEGIQPTISFSPPPEFQGEAGRWTPERFLVAAVTSCFVSTFEGMAQSSHFLFVSLRLSAEGVLAKETNGWRFSEFRLRPFVIVPKEEERDLAIHLLEKPRNRASSHGRFSAKSPSCQLCRSRKNCPCPLRLKL